MQGRRNRALHGHRYHAPHASRDRPAGGLPALMERAGDRAAWRLVDFSTATATIRHPKTREVYSRAVARFPSWCEGRRVEYFWNDEFM